MSAKRMFFLTALLGLLFGFANPVAAQEGCQFSNPVHDGRPLGDSIISGMHAVGSGALPGLDGIGAIYPMFPGTLAVAGWEGNPSGLQTTYVRIEGTGNCEGWVMDVFHLAFADGLQEKVGSVVDENTLLGVESMNGVASQFRAHWHGSVGHRLTPPQGESTVVTDAIGQVYWVNPLDLVGGNVESRRTPSGSNWGGIVLITGAAALLLAGGVFTVKNPRGALCGVRVVGQGITWMFEKSTEAVYWLHVATVELPFGNDKFFRAAIAAGIWAGICVIIPLTGLAFLSVITGGSSVEAVRLPHTSPSGQISVIFTPEIQAWAPKIVEWSRMHNLDENLVATIMQIESCGDASVVSPSGAQGLFQVMPFHFAAGEIMQDPDTNARRGLSYLRQTLAAYPDDLGRAIAAYNGGIGGTKNPDRSAWAAETQKYWYWGTGIFADIQSGATKSERLAEWLTADGGRLCPSTLQNKETP